MRPGGFSFKEAAAGDGPGEAGGEARFSRTQGVWVGIELQARAARGSCRDKLWTCSSTLKLRRRPASSNRRKDNGRGAAPDTSHLERRPASRSGAKRPATPQKRENRRAQARLRRAPSPASAAAGVLRAGPRRGLPGPKAGPGGVLSIYYRRTLQNRRRCLRFRPSTYTAFRGVRIGGCSRRFRVLPQAVMRGAARLPRGWARA